jgi:hypothetical protein
MDTSALAAQLIGEEPGFDVALQTAISGCKTKFTFTPARGIRQMKIEISARSGFFNYGQKMTANNTNYANVKYWQKPISSNRRF